jgi:hypothetical protein
MHAVSPEFVLGLSSEIYHQVPSAHVLGIQGYEWEFMSPPSAKAQENMQKAYVFLTSEIEKLLN